MKPKVRAARALAAYMATRSLRLVSLVSIIVFAILVIIIWLLAYQVSNWWWIAIVPVVAVGLFIILFRFIIKRIIKATYPDPLSQSQRLALDNLADKVVKLAEARSTPLPILALITIKDIVLKRDATTIRRLFHDSKSLTGDLRDLERHFKER